MKVVLEGPYFSKGDVISWGVVVREPNYTWIWLRQKLSGGKWIPKYKYKLKKLK